MKYFTSSAPNLRESAFTIGVARGLSLILGIIEMLLAFRFVFKLFGANPQSPFVDLVYALSGIFLAPFANIFPRTVVRTDITTSIFEPETLVAIIIYALIARGILALFDFIYHPAALGEP